MVAGVRSVVLALARILRMRRETTQRRTTTTSDNTKQSNRIWWRWEEDGDGDGDGDRNGKRGGKKEEECTIIEGRRRRQGDGGC